MASDQMCYQGLTGKWRQVRSSTTFFLEDMEFESLPLSLEKALRSHSPSQIHLNPAIWNHLYTTRSNTACVAEA